MILYQVRRPAALDGKRPFEHVFLASGLVAAVRRALRLASSSQGMRQGLAESAATSRQSRSNTVAPSVGEAAAWPVAGKSSKWPQGPGVGGRGRGACAWAARLSSWSGRPPDAHRCGPGLGLQAWRTRYTCCAPMNPLITPVASERARSAPGAGWLLPPPRPAVSSRSGCCPRARARRGTRPPADESGGAEPLPCSLRSGRRELPVAAIPPPAGQPRGWVGEPRVTGAGRLLCRSMRGRHATGSRCDGSVGRALCMRRRHGSRPALVVMEVLHMLAA